MDIYYKTRTRCVVCDEPAGEAVDLRNYPLTDMILDYKLEAVVDQKLMVCERCGHGQLHNLIHPNILYNKQYSLVTSTGMASKNNDLFYDFILKVTGGKYFNTILEIGCNDCYLLKKLENYADNLVGIDPILCGREEEFNGGKIQVFGTFIEQFELKHQDKPILVLASHVLEHIDDPRKLLDNLISKVGDDALFVFQFPEFNTLVMDYRFDQVYHHHIHYFSLHSFKYLINSLGYDIVDYAINPHYWGTLTVAFAKSGKMKINPMIMHLDFIRNNYNRFVILMDMLKYKLVDLNDVIAYGASLQYPVLMYHISPVAEPKIVVDDDMSKDGKYFINSNSIIRHSSNVDLKNANVLITAANFSRNIIQKLLQREVNNIIVPFNLV